jgi:hypothetical protein
VTVAVIRALTSGVQPWALGRGPGDHVVENPDGDVGAAGLGERVEEPVSQLGRWGSARREGKRAGGGGRGRAGGSGQGMGARVRGREAAGNGRR